MNQTVVNSTEKTQQRDELSAAFALTGLVKEGAVSNSSSVSDDPAAIPNAMDSKPLDAKVTSRHNSAAESEDGNVTVPTNTSAINTNTATRLQQQQTNGKFVRRSFPQKLMDILNDEQNSDIIKWLPCGTAFMIVDKKRFAVEILPQYFKQTQFTSFTRKLTRWNFIRVPRGPLMGTYYHKFFQRHNPNFCMKMSCNSAGNGLHHPQQGIPTAATAAKEVVRERSRVPHFDKLGVANYDAEIAALGGVQREEDLLHAAGTAGYPPSVALQHSLSSPLDCITASSAVHPHLPQSSSDVLMDKKMLAARMLEMQHFRRRYHVAHALYQARKAQEAQLALADLDILKAANNGLLDTTADPRTERLLSGYSNSYMPESQQYGVMGGMTRVPAPGVAPSSMPQQDIMNQLYLERLVQQEQQKQQHQREHINPMSLVGNVRHDQAMMMTAPPPSIMHSTPPPQDFVRNEVKSGDTTLSNFQASTAA